MTHEKLSPVLGLISAPTASQGTEIARAVVRMGGAGHSAAIHSNDSVAVMRYAARVPVLRVAVNVGNSLGSSGFETGLAATMTIGTGFVGRSSLGENLQPKHLINWTRIAYNSDARVGMPSFEGLTSSRHHGGRVPPYPVASNNTPLDDTERGRSDLLQFAAVVPGSPAETERDDFRDVIRQLVIDELSHLLKD